MNIIDIISNDKVKFYQTIVIETYFNPNFQQLRKNDCIESIDGKSIGKIISLNFQSTSPDFNIHQKIYNPPSIKSEITVAVYMGRFDIQEVIINGIIFYIMETKPFDLTY